MAVLGEPNVGKSTLVNRLIAFKVAAVTPKPQTTRERIMAVLTRAGGQAILLDTPGVHKARKALNRYLVDQAFAAASDADLALLMVEATARVAEPSQGETMILEKLSMRSLPAILAINKIDRLADPKLLLPAIESWSRRHSFRAVVPISCLKNDGLHLLEEEIMKALPEGPPLFDGEMITDRSERWLCQEILREELVRKLSQELPYSVAVVIEEFKERQDRNDVMIRAEIFVERQSQKGIVVGRNGRQIREIGISARQKMATLLNRPVHLDMRVKVEPDWTRDPDRMRRLGYGG